jgi:hypothetical protein
MIVCPSILEQLRRSARWTAGLVSLDEPRTEWQRQSDGEGRKGHTMRILPSLLIASALTLGVPMALADDLIIAPEIGIKFQDDVKVKKYKSHKWDGDLAVGVVVPADVEYYDVPEEVVVLQPVLKSHRYVYVNDRVYIVDTDRRIVAVVD